MDYSNNNKAEYDYCTIEFKKKLEIIELIAKYILEYRVKGVDWTLRMCRQNDGLVIW